MFAKVALIALVSSAVGVVAVPTASVSQCNTGDVQCCNQVTSASNKDTAALLSLLGINVQGIAASVGLGCTPVSVVGIASGVSCTQQPVCCTDNKFNGLVNLGCSPISL